jgi:hypothetical protein
MRTRDVRSESFERFAGSASMVVGLGGILYAILFITLLSNATKGAAVASSLLLVVGGILSTAVMIAVYGRLGPTDPGFALWALVIGVAGAIGSALHGGYDLALLAHKVVGAGGVAANPADPRGLATFGLTAIALAVISWLILRGEAFDRRLAYVGFVAAALLIGIYLGRLIVFNPKSPGLRVAAYVSGLVVNPVFFVWLGLELRKGSRQS